MILENLTSPITFTDSSDEKAFFLIMTCIEMLAPQIFDALEKGYYDDVRSMIKQVRDLTQLNFKLCNPEYFYNVIRKYLGGFDLEFETLGHFKFDGGSAAQSSLIRALDLILGIEHSRDQAYLDEINNYRTSDQRKILWG